MKIAIFTLPLINNYGGILQAFALFKTLQSLGHDVILLNFKPKNLSKFSILYLKFLIAKTFIARHKGAKFENIKQDEGAKKFILKNFTLSPEIRTKKELYRYVKTTDFDAIVVGSDQVLRPEFLGEFKDDFSLHFVNEKVIKILYAGSFGGAEFQGENTKFHALNFAKFKAVSVREKNAVEIFERNFERKPLWVLDPTLLADFKIYDFSNKNAQKNYIFAYILDPDENKKAFLQIVAKQKKLKIIELNDQSLVRPSPKEWLSLIKNADFVVTDSFHGCVFSVIFHKNFYTFTNEKRGNDRIISFLEMLNLTSRFIDENTEISDISWEKVDEILKIKKEISLNFLKESLK